MTYPGFFLSFEGVDGCGKTTQLERFAARVEQAGYRLVRAQEPGGTRIGREIEENSRHGDAGSLGRLVAQLENYLSRVHPEFH